VLYAAVTVQVEKLASQEESSIRHTEGGREI
jgi:hypothetical protein